MLSPRWSEIMSTTIDTVRLLVPQERADGLCRGGIVHRQMLKGHIVVDSLRTMEWKQGFPSQGLDQGARRIAGQRRSEATTPTVRDMVSKRKGVRVHHIGNDIPRSIGAADGVHDPRRPDLFGYIFVIICPVVVVFSREWYGTW